MNNNTYLVASRAKHLSETFKQLSLHVFFQLLLGVFNKTTVWTQGKGCYRAAAEDLLHALSMGGHCDDELEARSDGNLSLALV